LAYELRIDENEYEVGSMFEYKWLIGWFKGESVGGLWTMVKHRG